MGFYKRNDAKTSWKFEHYMGYRPDGKRRVITKTVQAKNEREAKRKYHLWVSAIEKGEYQTPSNITFKNFVEEKWIQLHAKQHLEPNTYETYLGILRSIIIPQIGAAKLNELRTIDIQEMLVELGEGRKPSTIQKYKVVLRSVFNRALEWEYINKHPIKDIKIGGQKLTKKDSFSIKELEEIISLVSEDDLQWSVIVHLALYCGLRRSEILGLTWDKVDFQNNRLEISQALTLDKKEGNNTLRLKTTKSSDTRFVPINNKLNLLLEQLKTKKINDRDISGEKWYKGKEFFVVSNDTGKPYRPDSITQRWGRFRERHGIRKLSFHYLRHSCATFLNHNGVNPKTIASILGHADVSTTFNMYTDVYKQDFENVAENFNVFQ